MKRTVIVATNNQNKLAEFRDILGRSGVQLLSLAEAGIVCDPEESGATIAENARIKARAVWALAHAPVLADDTGLFVDALGGEPGVHAARYAGDPQDSARNISKLLAGLGALPQEERTARFRTALCYIDEAGAEHDFFGECEGWIAFERLGEGFGYEPVFCLWNGFSLAQLGKEKKDKRSHRARAAHKLAFYFRNIKRMKTK